MGAKSAEAIKEDVVVRSVHNFDPSILDMFADVREVPQSIRVFPSKIQKASGLTISVSSGRKVGAAERIWDAYDACACLEVVVISSIENKAMIMRCSQSEHAALCCESTR